MALVACNRSICTAYRMDAASSQHIRIIPIRGGRGGAAAEKKGPVDDDDDDDVERDEKEEEEVVVPTSKGALRFSNRDAGRRCWKGDFV